MMPVNLKVRSYRLHFPTVDNNIVEVNNSQRFQLRLVQSDNRGGFCDCWAVGDLKLTVGNSSELEVPLT